MKIQKIIARKILDSRGNPTVEADVILEDGTLGKASIPSGASTGKNEAIEIKASNAVENVNTKIAEILIGMDALEQREIDKKMIELDGTENKSNLGANAILAVSMACARAEALSEGKSLYEYLAKFNPDHNGIYTMPLPMMNIMNGGKHANWATDVQEYMIFPVGAKTICEAVRMCAEIYANLKKILKANGYGVGVGDEGGYAPAVKSNEEPFKLMSEAIAAAGYNAGKPASAPSLQSSGVARDVCLGIDAAATEFLNKETGKYSLHKEGKEMTSDELSAFYQDLASHYPIVSMEDIFSEDDWSGFGNFTKATNNKIQIVGDDLYVTNPKRLARGVEEKTTNSILIKLNQIGTISETVDAILLARKNGMTSVVSHRSGETKDTFIADFVVAMSTGQIKTGAPCRSERTAKYNRLMKIERELGDKAKYVTFPF